MPESRRRGGAHSADNTRRSRRSAPVKPVDEYEDEYEDKYDNEYDGGYEDELDDESAYKPHNGGGSVKYILLGLVLLLIVAVLVVLCVRCSRSGSGTAENIAAANMTSTVTFQDSYGEDMGGNIELTAGTSAPDGVDPASAVLMNAAWVGKKTATFPMIMKISDSSFRDGDGLIVFQSVNGQWQRLDTYIISDHSITFLVDSLGAFAFVPYDEYATPTPLATDTPVPTATPTATPKGSASPSPSAKPSPTPTPKNTTTTTYTNTTTKPVSTPEPDSQATEPPIQSDDSGNGGGGNTDSTGSDAIAGDDVIDTSSDATTPESITSENTGNEDSSGE